MIIYKSRVLDIIKHEPLTPGNFDDGHGNRCVIGQILHDVNPKKSAQEINDAGEFLTQFCAMHRKPMVLAKDGNLFGALSALFENVTFDAGDVVTPAVREELLTFVANHFPESIETPL